MSRRHANPLCFIPAIGKKVEKIGKTKTTKYVLNWVQSIKNHVYWCASSSNDNPELVRDKWLSLLNHIRNVHEGHGKLYKKYTHEAVERAWLDKG